MPDWAIQTWNLRKRFGEKVAVEGLTLEVHRGEVFGFLGPNGAGKSTSVKMLLSLIEPTGGRAQVLGRPLADAEARRGVGFLPEHFRFHEWLTAAEFLRFHGRLYDMPPERCERRAGELLDLVGLTAHRDRRLSGFSKGMLQRIGLAQALLNEPDLVFLDEPTSGLDPVGRRMVRDVIKDQRERGATVFLNSHLLSEVEITCDRVAFIKNGKTLLVSDLAKLVAGQLTVTARVTGLREETLAGLARWTKSHHVEGDRLTLEAQEEEALPEILNHLAASGARVYDFRSQRLSLEELFVEIVGTDGGL